MPATYTLIASNTLSSSAASVTFSAIPNTYTDLVLKWSARSDRATYSSVMMIYFNSTTGLSSWRQLYTEGTGAFSGNDTRPSVYETLGGYNPGANQTSNTFANGEIYVPNYTSTALKQTSVFAASEVNSASTEYHLDAVASLVNLSSAVTAITLKPYSTVQFVSGSSFFLYGIKNS